MRGDSAGTTVFPISNEPGSRTIVDGVEVEVEILGERRKTTVHLSPLWDGDGARMRG